MVKAVINLYINQRQAGEVTILDLKGKLRVGGNTVALHRSLRTLVIEGKKLIVLNLAGVTHIDSCGLGELVASQVSVENKGGQLKLVGLTELLRELFGATRLTTVFDTYEDEAEALEQFALLTLASEKPALTFA